jgi:hypothetical protein
MRGRSKHGHLVRVWTRVNHRRTSRGNRELVAAYLKSDEGFLADFAALDPERRWLALEAVAAALERFRPPTAARVGRIKWKSSPEWQERIRDAARRWSDDKTIARELGLSVGAARTARHRYAGPRRDKPHIARIAA